MTNTTSLYWEAGSLSLHTYAWSIRTKGDGRSTWAPKRGDDFVLPHQQGQYRVKKYYDARVLPLPMWVKGVNQDGSIDGTMSKADKLMENWRTLMSAFTAENRIDLVKRFRVAGY